MKSEKKKTTKISDAKDEAAKAEVEQKEQNDTTAEDKEKENNTPRDDETKTQEKTIKKNNEIKKDIEGAEVMKETEKIVVFKASKPLKPYEHKELSERIRFENEKAGIKVVLAPYLVDEAEIGEGK